MGYSPYGNGAGDAMTSSAFPLDKFIPSNEQQIELTKALLAASVPDVVHATLTLLYGRIPSDLKSSLVDDEGRIVLVMSKKMFATMRRASNRAVTRHLEKLQEVGVIDFPNLDPSSHSWKVAVYPAHVAYKRVLGNPGVMAHLSSIPREATPLSRNSTSSSASEAESNTSNEPTDAREWIESRKEKTRELLQNAREEAGDRTSRAGIRRASSMYSGMKQTRNKNPTPRADTPAGVGEYLRSRIKSGLGSVYQLNITQKDLALLKTLIADNGADNVRRGIDYATEKTSWGRLRKRCRIKSEVPTVGVLCGFGATIFPLALQGGIEKPARRSGGAEDLPASSTTLDRNEKNNRNGYFA